MRPRFVLDDVDFQCDVFVVKTRVPSSFLCVGVVFPLRRLARGLPVVCEWVAGTFAPSGAPKPLPFLTHSAPWAAQGQRLEESAQSPLSCSVDKNRKAEGTIVNRPFCFSDSAVPGVKKCHSFKFPSHKTLTAGRFLGERDGCRGACRSVANAEPTVSRQPHGGLWQMSSLSSRWECGLLRVRRADWTGRRMCPKSVRCSTSLWWHSRRTIG